MLSSFSSKTVFAFFAGPSQYSLRIFIISLLFLPKSFAISETLYLITIGISSCVSLYVSILLLIEKRNYFFSKIFIINRHTSGFIPHTEIYFINSNICFDNLYFKMMKFNCFFKFCYKPWGYITAKISNFALCPNSACCAISCPIESLPARLASPSIEITF